MHVFWTMHKEQRFFHSFFLYLQEKGGWYVSCSLGNLFLLIARYHLYREIVHSVSIRVLMDQAGVYHYIIFKKKEN